jgi:hypothetical protein
MYAKHFSDYLKRVIVGRIRGRDASLGAGEFRIGIETFTHGFDKDVAAEKHLWSLSLAQVRCVLGIPFKTEFTALIQLRERLQGFFKFTVR